MICDSHCHILDPKLDEKRDEILRSLGTDLEFIVEISASHKESRESLAFAQSNTQVFCTIGVHPIFANTYNKEFEEWAKRAMSDPNNRKKIVAVGECGLDYFHLDSAPQTQKDAFIAQIELSHALRLPLVVHSRDSFDDTLEILLSHKEYLTNGVLIHCFSYTAQEVAKFAKLDAYFAFGGAITYKNNKTANDAIRAVPRDRLLIETDCPYLTPVPFRGQVNEPKNVQLVADHIAKVLEMSINDVTTLTTKNAKNFYKISG